MTLRVLDVSVHAVHVLLLPQRAREALKVRLVEQRPRGLHRAGANGRRPSREGAKRAFEKRFHLVSLVSVTNDFYGSSWFSRTLRVRDDTMFRLT